MKHKITHRVHAEEIHQRIGIEHISLGFAHLAVALQQPRMTEHLLRQLHTQSHQENGPINGMEADNVLADQMQISRPILLKLLGTVAVAIIPNSGNIVGQRIQPHIGHMLGIEGNRNSPAERGSGHTQVLKPGQQEIVHHLIFSGDGLNKLRMSVDVLNQPGRILAHAEEIGLLLGRLHLAATVWTLAVHQLGLGKKGLAGRAVHALIIPLINVSLVIQALENLLHLSLVVRVRGADKLVVGGVHQIPDPFDLLSGLVHKLLGRHARRLGLLLDLLAVLIRSGLEKHVAALGPLIAGDTVGQHDLVGIADVGLAGGICDGRGDIIWLFTILTHGFIPSFPGQTPLSPSCPICKRPFGNVSAP